MDCTPASESTLRLTWSQCSRAYMGWAPRSKGSSVTYRACKNYCLECPRCNYISFSKGAGGACGWFHACPTPLLMSMPALPKELNNTFWTQRVRFPPKPKGNTSKGNSSKGGAKGGASKTSAPKGSASKKGGASKGGTSSPTWLQWGLG